MFWFSRGFLPWLAAFYILLPSLLEEERTCVCFTLYICRYRLRALLFFCWRPRPHQLLSVYLLLVLRLVLLLAVCAGDSHTREEEGASPAYRVCTAGYRTITVLLLLQKRAVTTTTTTTSLLAGYIVEDGTATSTRRRAKR